MLDKLLVLSFVLPMSSQEAGVRCEAAAVADIVPVAEDVAVANDDEDEDATPEEEEEA